MGDTRYCINYEVCCRVEEPEGAVLFNPINDNVRIINPTGLVIWQALDAFPRKKGELVEYILMKYTDAAVDQVIQDVNEFVDELNAVGFIGEVIE